MFFSGMLKVLNTQILTIGPYKWKIIVLFLGGLLPTPVQNGGISKSTDSQCCYFEHAARWDLLLKSFFLFQTPIWQKINALTKTKWTMFIIQYYTH